jgi:hypothetical protein
MTNVEMPSDIGPASTSESLLEKEWKLFFNRVYTSFFKRDIDNLSLENDCRQIQKYFLNSPYETMEVVNNVGGLKFSYFIVIFLNCYYFPYYTESILPKSPKTRKIDHQEAFFTFNEFFHKYFSDDTKRPSKYQKKFIELIISILKRLGKPNHIIFIQTPDLKKFSILTKEYIEAWRIFAYNLQDESAIGFEKAYYLLKRLSESNPKGIPIHSKSLVFSLLFLCRYYALAISEVDYKALEPNTTNPLMISFLLKLLYSHGDPELLFSVCRSRSIDDESFRYLKTETCVAFILEEYKFGNNPHQGSLVNGILEVFKIYLKLAQYKSHQKPYQERKNHLRRQIW